VEVVVFTTTALQSEWHVKVAAAGAVHVAELVGAGATVPTQSIVGGLSTVTVIVAETRLHWPQWSHACQFHVRV